MDREITRSERFRLNRSRYIRWGIGIGAAAIAVITGLTLYKPSVSRSEIALGAADTGDIEVAVTGTGRIVPAFEEMISSPVGSRILEVYCHPGDEVEPGTPLMRLDLESTRIDYEKMRDQLDMARLELEKLEAANNTRLNDLRMRIEVAEMNLNRLTMQLANERYLDSIGGGTTDQVREVEYSQRSSALELEQLREQLRNERRSLEADLQMKRLDIEIREKDLAKNARMLSDAEIRATRRATVTSIANQIGQQVSPGQELAILSDLGHYRVEGDVADSYGRDLRAGSRVVVKVSRKEFAGTVTSVSPTSKGGLYSFGVALDCDSAAELRAGLKPDVYIQNGLRSGVTRIPVFASYTGPGAYEMYVDNGNNELERRKVMLGQSGPDYIEVVSGIVAGEKVVLSDTRSFSDNDKIILR